MDHRYIDQHSVAIRYLNHELAPGERAEFEAHLVDCPECTDRLLLAEMFHTRDGLAGKPAPGKPVPMRVRFVEQFQPWQLLLIFLAAAILLLLAPVAYFIWRLRGAG